MQGMARTALISLALLGTSGCGEKAPSDAEAIAAVEAAQDGKPPVKPLQPQPILYPDITQNKLHGTGCAFVADGGGLGAVLLAQDKRGIIKLDGHVEVLAPDAGSHKMPKGSWSRYTGKERALTLTAIGPITPAGGADQFKGKLIITDAFERPVFEATGDVQCKAI
ncbi:hypothetical protein Saro_2126 [Novosphingobium aromaticivorans DSM 12444]|uniref:Lipoprotein n=2 Tax=Novosphingobium aromaticivorans TaxID=48935 RepID=Q2G6F8_NOVAD|nr:hypothetical protein Saro_2126 [Novosphingobium aromaticivorans DSM 12444]SCY75538.1 hypothetical protein SAMN05660666_02763 [Novosphingobium aromaticivorans]